MKIISINIRLYVAIWCWNLLQAAIRCDIATSFTANGYSVPGGELAEHALSRPELPFPGGAKSRSCAGALGCLPSGVRLPYSNNGATNGF